MLTKNKANKTKLTPEQALNILKVKKSILESQIEDMEKIIKEIDDFIKVYNKFKSEGII
jgi:hypothetical protein